MSDSFSKSEGYSSFLRDSAVPSTPMCCFIIFIILVYYNNITGIYGTIFAFIFFILFIVTLINTVSHYKIFINNKKIFLLILTIIIMVCSSISVFFKNKISNLILDGSLPEYIENISVIIDDVNFKRYSSGIYFSAPVEKNLRLKGILYYQGETIFNKGDTLFIHKRIQKVSANRNSQFNNYLISRGIHFTSGISDPDITILNKNDPPLRNRLQYNLLKRIDVLFKQPTAGVIKALLTGNQNYIEKKIILQYRESGVLHCLSASGLHVGIFAIIPAFLLLPFIRRNIAMFISLLSVLSYLYITDMPVSLLRAVIMFGLFYFQLILFRKRNVFNYLMLTASIILIISPWEIFSPGFQLSFAATGGILIFFKQYRKSMKNIPAMIADSTAVTLSAQIMTIPIIIFHMNQFNTAGIAANIIIIPLITLIMGIAIFTIVLSPLSISAAVFFGNIADLLLKFTLLITKFISGLRLNFFVYDITPILFVLISISLIPLVNHRKILKLKFYPIVISVIFCTLYLKQNLQSNEKNYTITTGNSTAEIRTENKTQILKLNLEDGVDTEEVVYAIKKNNPDIKIIELGCTNNASILTSKKIMNDYIINEYRFAQIPFLDKTFKNIISQLEKDNVIVKFNSVK